MRLFTLGLVLLTVALLAAVVTDDDLREDFARFCLCALPSTAGDSLPQVIPSPPLREPVMSKESR